MHLVNDSWQLTDLKAKHRFHIHFIQITVTPESNLHPYILSDNEKFICQQKLSLTLGIETQLEAPKPDANSRRRRTNRREYLLQF
jgi:hypothetical protein